MHVFLGVTYLGVGLLCALLAVPLIRGAVPPNVWYGLRTPDTLQDRRVWLVANRRTGWGLVVVAVSFALVGAVFLAVPATGENIGVLLALLFLPEVFVIGLAVDGIVFARRLRSRLRRQEEEDRGAGRG